MYHHQPCAVVALVVLSWGCSNATAPVAQLTHPMGVITAAPAVSARPFAVAISSHAVAYLGRQDVPYVQTTTLPDTAFADSVLVGTDPTDIAFSASGATAYVTDQLSGSISIVTVATGRATDSIALSANPFRVLVRPGDAEILVSCNNDSVYEIAVPSKHTVHAWGFDTPVNGITQSRSGAVVFVSDIGGHVFALSAAAGTKLDSVSVGGRPQDIVVSQNGTRLFLANETGSMLVLDATTLAPLDSVAGATGAFSLRLTPDGAQLYAGYPGTGTVLIIDATTHSVVGPLAVGGVPRRIAFDNTGTTGLIANESGYVTVVQ
jgi:YVTN family beta-propeller protein